MSAPSRRTVPAGRVEQARDAVADRRLAAAGLADEAEHLAGRDRERDAVDRVHDLPAAADARARPGSA